MRLESGTTSGFIYSIHSGVDWFDLKQINVKKSYKTF